MILELDDGKKKAMKSRIKLFSQVLKKNYPSFPDDWVIYGQGLVSNYFNETVTKYFLACHDNARLVNWVNNQEDRIDFDVKYWYTSGKKFLCLQIRSCPDIWIDGSDLTIDQKIRTVALRKHELISYDFLDGKLGIAEAAQRAIQDKIISFRLKNIYETCKNAVHFSNIISLVETLKKTENLSVWTMDSKAMNIIMLLDVFIEKVIDYANRNSIVDPMDKALEYLELMQKEANVFFEE